jgi:hypothetical protein
MFQRDTPKRRPPALGFAIANTATVRAGDSERRERNRGRRKRAFRVAPVSVRVAGYGSPWCAPRYKACDETEDAVGLCAPAQPIWTPVIQKPTREGRRGLRNIRRPELGEMAMVLPLAVPAASAAPGTCISGAPAPAPLLGTRAHLSLGLPGTPRGVACALRRRPTEYRQVISHRCLISSSRFCVIGALRHAWMSHESSLEA